MKRSRLLFSAGLFYLAVVAIGCNQSNPVVPPVNVNELQSEVTGEGFFSAADGQAKDQGSYYAVLASESFQMGSRSINVIVPKQTSVPYTVNVGSDPVAVLSYDVSSDNVTHKQFYAQQGVGSGTITVTQVTPTLEGSFSGTLWQVPNAGADTVRTLASGQFNASF